MMKVKITITNTSDMPEIEAGRKLTCKKEPTNKFDDKAIMVLDGSDRIGYISNSKKTTAVDCVNNHGIFDQVADTFQATVLRMDTLSTGHRNKRVIIAEVEVEGTASDSSVGGDTTTARLKIKGSATKYTEKNAVISAQKNAIKAHEEAVVKGDRKHVQDSIMLTAKLSDKDTIVVFTESGGPAGIAEMKDKAAAGCADIATIENLKNVLKDTGEMECLVVGMPDISTYVVEFTIPTSVVEEAGTKAAKKIVEEVKDKLIAEGFDADTLSNIEDILLTAGLSANYITDWFNTFVMYPDEEKGLIPKWDEVKTYQDNNNRIKLAVGAILKQKHLNLLGEKGTGKNTFADYILYLAQRPKHELSGNGQTAKSEFFGEPTIHSEVAEGGAGVIHEISFAAEEFVKAMGYKEDDPKRHAGGCALIDEANGIPADVLMALNSSADARRAVTVPNYGRVNAGENFFIILTMNIGYEGTRNLNEAFKDRFVPILFDPYDSIDMILRAKCPNASKADITKANKVYMKMRSIAVNNDGELDMSCITLRGFIDALDLAEFVGLKEALIINVADRILDDEEYRKKTKDIIESIVG